MLRVVFRFYAELNEHLPAEFRQRDFAHAVSEGSTLADALALLRVPAAEVELILAGGQSVGFDHVVKEGERVSVFPVFDAMDVGAVTRVERRPPRRTRFLLDVHLGKLAHHLRMLGFDAAYRNDSTPAELFETARREDRILLSRSQGLIGREGLGAGYRVTSSDPRTQLIEVLRRFDLLGVVRPFTRCLHCNVEVRSVPETEVQDRLPRRSHDAYHEFTLCPSCGRVYWKGSHVERMLRFSEAVFAEVREGLRE